MAGGGRSGVWRSRERAHNKLIISSERAQVWDRRSRAGSADGNDDGLLRTIASRLRTEAKTRMPIWRSGSEGERCELRTEAGELLTLAQLIGEGLFV